MQDESETETVEPIWFDAEPELVEKIGRNAKLRGETVGEFIATACRRYERGHSGDRTS